MNTTLILGVIIIALVASYLLGYNPVFRILIGVLLIYIIFEIFQRYIL